MKKIHKVLKAVLSIVTNLSDDDRTAFFSFVEKGGIYNACDTAHPSFHELETLIASQLGKPHPKSIPYFIAKLIACMGDLVGKNAPINSFKLDKITKSLTFSNEKARKELGWEPLNVLENFKIY